MSKKYKIIFCGIAFALAAIIVGLCLVFFGNKTIKTAPNSLEVQKIEGQYYLVSEFNGEYHYQFKLEQFIEDEFFTVGIVDSETNTLKLEDCSLNINAGGRYRFSVRFVNENGGGKGKFCEPLLWSPSLSLNNVNYDDVVFEEDTLSWKVVPQAENYTVVAVGADLNKSEIFCTQTSCDLSGLKAGRYNIYIIANSTDEFVESSDAGAGKMIVVERKNVLTDVHMTDWTLYLKSSYEVLKFEVYADGVLLGRLDAQDYVDGTYSFENCSILFSGVDLTTSEIKIKSLKNDCVLESNLTIVSKI